MREASSCALATLVLVLGLKTSSCGSSGNPSNHLWAMGWDSKNLQLSLDDELVYNYKIPSSSPYIGNRFYILVNLAIGANGGDPTGTSFPILYEVDYVRVYKAL